MKPFYQEPMATVYCGSALEVLRELPDESIQMAMTSPPYWGLRNYAGGDDVIWGGNDSCEHNWDGLVKHRSIGGPQVPQTKWQSNVSVVEAQRDTNSSFCSLCGAWRGQLGLEPIPELYVVHLMMIFQEVKRVLKKDGAFYLNIGDTYAGSWGDSGHRPERTGIPGHQRAKHTEFLDRKGHPQMKIPPTRQALKLTSLKPKSMTCIPERVLFAMLEDGWILRHKIIWHKPNSMPSSVKDRFSATWEYLYFFVKARKYYFDLDAVRQPHKSLSLERYQRGVNLGRPAEGKSGEVGPMQQYERAPQWFKDMYPPNSDYKGKFDELFGHGPQPQSFNLRVRDVKRGKRGTSAQSGELKASEQEIEDYRYPEKHHGSSMSNQESLHIDRKYSEETMKITGHGIGLNEKGHSGYFYKDGTPAVNPKGKNPGDLWSITTKPSSISVCPQCDAVFPRLIK